MDFAQIPDSLRTPGVHVEFNDDLALLALAGLHQKILIMGQMLSTGTATEETLYQIVREGQADELFGQGSTIARTIKAALEANSYNEMWAVALTDDDAGVAATGTITFGGAPTAAGTLSVMIAGQRVRIAVASDDTAAEVATAFAAAVTANKELPVSAAVNGGTPEQVDLTARNKGEMGNSIDIRLNYYSGEVLPTGLTATIVAMASGSGNPDISLAIAPLADMQFHAIVCPWLDAANVTLLETEMARRWEALVQIEGIAYLATTSGYSAAYSYGGTRNAPYTTTMAGCNSPTPPWEWAGCYAGIALYSFNTDANRPLHSLELPGILPAAESVRLTQNERNNLLHNGMTTHTVDSSGKVLLGKTITNYRLNSQGVEDVSWLELPHVSGLMEYRYQLRYTLSNTYPRFKLADDSYTIRSGQAITQPRLIKETIRALHRSLEKSGLLHKTETYDEDLVVERHATNRNRVDIRTTPAIIPGLDVIATLAQFRLT